MTSASFFEAGALGFACGIRMARTRPLDRVADGGERIEASLIVNGLDGEELRQPPRDLRAAPESAVIGRRLDALLEPFKSVWREDFRFGCIARTQIAELFGTALVVMFDERLHPACRKRQELGGLIGGVARSQQPNRVKMRLGDRFDRRLVTQRQRLNAQMRRQLPHDRISTDES